MILREFKRIYNTKTFIFLIAFVAINCVAFYVSANYDMYDLKTYKLIDKYFYDPDYKNVFFESAQNNEIHNRAVAAFNYIDSWRNHCEKYESVLYSKENEIARKLSMTIYTLSSKERLNLLKTHYDIEHMHGSRIEYGNYTWINRMTQFRLDVALGILFVFIILFDNLNDCSFKSLVKTCAGGRDKLAWTHLMVIVSLALSFVFWAEIMTCIIAVCFYGTGGTLLANIHSSPAFGFSTMNCNFLEYLIRLFWIKIFIIVSQSLLMFVPTMFFTKKAEGIFVDVIIISAELVLFLYIRTYSNIYFLKLFNIFSMCEIGNIISHYSNYVIVNLIFGKSTAIIVFIGIVTVLFGFVFFFVDRGMGNTSKGKVFSTMHKLTSKLMNVFFEGNYIVKELYLKLIINRILFPLIILIAIAVYVRIPNRNGMGETDAALKTYYVGVSEVDNPRAYTVEYISSLENLLAIEKVKYELCVQEGNNYAAENISENIDLLSNMLYELKNQLEYADRINQENNIGYFFVQQNKYTELFGERNKAFRNRNLIITVIFLLFVGGFTISKSGFNCMNNIYMISATGWKKISIKRASTDIVIISVMSWVFYLIYIVHALHLYDVDLGVLSHSVLSLYIFADFPFSISIGGYIFCAGLVRNLVCVFGTIIFNYILYRKEIRS